MLKVIHKIKDTNCELCHMRCTLIAGIYGVEVEKKARGDDPPSWEIYRDNKLIKTIEIEADTTNVPMKPIYQALNEIIKPNLIRKILNFIKSMWLSKGQKISNIESDRRLTICNPCPFNSSGDCSLCGCPVVSKTRYKNLSCDNGYW